ncbi:unnamed protein product [Closterium sp. NIES-54]
MGPPRIPRFMAAVAPLVATDVTGATASFLLSWRRAGRLVLPRCSFALSPAQRYLPRLNLPHPVLSRTQQQPRAAAYGHALLRAATYDRAQPRTAVCASTSARRQHLRGQQLTPPPPSLPQLPPWGEGDVGVAGPAATPPLSLTAACAAVGGRVREGGGKTVKHLQLPPAATVAPPAAAPAATCPCTRQQRQQSQPETPLLQQPREWFSQRRVSGSVGAAALGAGESAAALDASETAATGACESSTSESTASAEALHTFTLDSCASLCFFRDAPQSHHSLHRSQSYWLTPLEASSSHEPPLSSRVRQSLQLSFRPPPPLVLDEIGQRVAICTCSWTGRRLAIFTRQPGSSLYTLTTASAQVAMSSQVAVSNQVSASGQFAASCSCRVLSHQTLLRHHRLGHPSLPHLCNMHSRLLVCGLPKSLPPLPRSLAPLCLPCVEGRQRAAPHSSCFLRPLLLCTLSTWTSQPLTPCLFAKDLAHTPLDGRGWRCVGVSGLGRALPCLQYQHEQALSSRSPLRLPGLPHRCPAMAVLPPSLASSPVHTDFCVCRVESCRVESRRVASSPVRGR